MKIYFIDKILYVSNIKFIFKGNVNTGASFKILSEAHAQVMIALHPYLAPAIKKQKNRVKGYGDWFLVGVTQNSTKYEIFKALLLVNGKKDT